VGYSRVGWGVHHSDPIFHLAGDKIDTEQEFWRQRLDVAPAQVS
jgi:hypothetical protein